MATRCLRGFKATTPYGMLHLTKYNVRNAVAYRKALPTSRNYHALARSNSITSSPLYPRSVDRNACRIRISHRTTAHDGELAFPRSFTTGSMVSVKRHAQGYCLIFHSGQDRQGTRDGRVHNRRHPKTIFQEFVYDQVEAVAKILALKSW